ncbi:MAG: MFS transporter [Bacteroidia bacterium]
MDRLGAIGGPLLAMWVLGLTNENLREVFLWAAIPGLLGLLVLFLVKEKSIPTSLFKKENTQVLKHNPKFQVFFWANVLFALGNSSNAFLILKAQETGIALTMIPLVWMVYNAFCTISSPIFGGFSDRYGRKDMIGISFIFYGLLYLLFAFAQFPWEIWCLFAGYGIYYGLSHGVSKAYIADLVAEDQRATAYGVFTTGTGIALLPASLIMGFLWDLAGSQWAFIFSAVMAILGFLVWIVGERMTVESR